MAANSETIVLPRNYRLRAFVESRGFNAFVTAVIIVKSFTVLNLFIALIVNSMQTLTAETTEEIHEEAELAHSEREVLSRQITDLSEEVRRLRRQITD
jgi:voltage-gated sodium channel